MMVLLKVVRQLIRHKQDNLDDIEGYAYIMGVLEDNDAKGQRTT